VQTRPLGATGLQVSPLGLGLAALGRPAYIDLGRDRDLGPDRDVEALERRCHQVLDAAYAAGVRYLDAARSYGRAEEFLASCCAPATSTRPRSPSAPNGATPTSATGAWTPTPTRSRTTPSPP
jgi:aryl-alcohol dehydrogenase-like predicted oxidoreductase